MAMTRVNIKRVLYLRWDEFFLDGGASFFFFLLWACWSLWTTWHGISLCILLMYKIILYWTSSQSRNATTILSIIVFFLLPVHVFSCIFPDGIDLISFLHKETSSMEHTCTQFMVNSSLYREPLVLIPLNVPFMIWISCTSSLACSWFQSHVLLVLYVHKMPFSFCNSCCTTCALLGTWLCCQIRKGNFAKSSFHR
jgi:hypothetical protein